MKVKSACWQVYSHPVPAFSVARACPVLQFFYLHLLPISLNWFLCWFMLNKSTWKYWEPILLTNAFVLSEAFSVSKIYNSKKVLNWFTGSRKSPGLCRRKIQSLQTGGFFSLSSFLHIRRRCLLKLLCFVLLHDERVSIKFGTKIKNLRPF